MRQDAAPVYAYTPCRVPHPLMPIVEEKLTLVKKAYVTSPFSEPTEWYSRMAVAMKTNVEIRICLDLTSLNKTVRQEIHSMANVDDNLAKLKVYS